MKISKALKILSMLDLDAKVYLHFPDSDTKYKSNPEPNSLSDSFKWDWPVVDKLITRNKDSQDY